MTRRRAVVGTVLLGYLVFLAVVLLAPTSQKPAAAVTEVEHVLQAAGAPDYVSFGPLEWFANVALFMPLGALVALIAMRLQPRRARVAVAVGAALALSALAESAQQLWRPERVASLADVLADTLGGLLGGVAVVLVTRARARRRSVERGATHHLR